MPDYLPRGLWFAVTEGNSLDAEISDPGAPSPLDYTRKGARRRRIHHDRPGGHFRIGASHMRPQLPIAALIQAAITFAAIGLVALMGFAYLERDFLTIKLVLLATFGSYIAQVLFVWAENDDVPAVRQMTHLIGSIVFLLVVTFVLTAVGRALMYWG